MTRSQVGFLETNDLRRRITGGFKFSLKGRPISDVSCLNCDLSGFRGSPMWSFPGEPTIGVPLPRHRVEPPPKTGAEKSHTRGTSLEGPYYIGYRGGSCAAVARSTADPRSRSSVAPQSSGVHDNSVVALSRQCDGAHAVPRGLLASRAQAEADTSRGTRNVATITQLTLFSGPMAMSVGCAVLLSHQQGVQPTRGSPKKAALTTEPLLSTAPGVTKSPGNGDAAFTRFRLSFEMPVPRPTTPRAIMPTADQCRALPPRPVEISLPYERHYAHNAASAGRNNPAGRSPSASSVNAHTTNLMGWRHDCEKPCYSSSTCHFAWGSP